MVTDNINRFIFIEGTIETLAFFSKELAASYEAMGFDTWFWKMKRPLKSRHEFEKLDQKEKSILITFNFEGLSGESQFISGDKDIWSENGISVMCIMADHPVYYQKILEENRNGMGRDWKIFCVDRGHCRYMKRFYPEYNVEFLPLAGTKYADDVKEIEERDIDVLFTGNYVPLPKLMKYMTDTDQEVRDYYMAIVSELIKNSDSSLEDIVVSKLERDFEGISDEDIVDTMNEMIFVDLYIRSCMRREIICSLAEAGIKVHVVGENWDKAQCRRPENLIIHGSTDSEGCLKYMSRSKIALNVMPWFKDGAHDRIFNGMLQGCVVVSDTSKYLDEELRDDEDIKFFELSKRGSLPAMIRDILKDHEQMHKIAQNGYERALNEHTWEKRAQQLLENIRTLA